ncbi:MAG: HPr(Ser) kinase/phosphatase [Pyrinomonadaceae bacterium]|nr:HPr(Ser) kinase/phosphatase [Pyrinomonadaceae bacterium]MCX7639738.1 HPr(Ser) kinase/phosphatase [Pyrinomonadaceae bacterium]MDW8304321.1 HPr(Ser) kinase/phosphatase [Acidobacteriota bacterium]
MNQINPKITVAEFIEKAPKELSLEVLTGKDFLDKKQINSYRIQKLGLALAGFSHYIHEGRIQIVGQSEISYLKQLSKKKRVEAIKNLDLEKITCILITKNLEPSPDLLQIASEKNLVVLRTPKVSSIAISLVSNFLQEALAPQMTIHAVLLGMYGLGVLIKGSSGIGKSECALDLITRGHQLVSDDVVIVKRIGDRLEGSSPELTFELLEIRGLGIINIRDLFGVSAISKQKNIDLCIELKNWDKAEEIERLGIETQEEKIFGVSIPKFVLPVSPGRNLSTLVETAVRVHLLRIKGYDATQKLIETHAKQISNQALE